MFTKYLYLEKMKIIKCFYYWNNIEDKRQVI